MDTTKSVSAHIEINASRETVWSVITLSEYAKLLGGEFDKNAFVESDWKLGSKVYFKYADDPGKACNTGKISKLVEKEYIQVDYRFFLFWKYREAYSLRELGNGCVLQIDAGPYGADLENQKVTWKNWLSKVKKLCETNR